MLDYSWKIKRAQLTRRMWRDLFLHDQAIVWLDLTPTYQIENYIKITGQDQIYQIYFITDTNQPVHASSIICIVYQVIMKCHFVDTLWWWFGCYHIGIHTSRQSNLQISFPNKATEQHVCSSSSDRRWHCCADVSQWGKEESWNYFEHIHPISVTN